MRRGPGIEWLHPRGYIGCGDANERIALYSFLLLIDTEKALN
jgi:hypothetical protein